MLKVITVHIWHGTFLNEIAILLVLYVIPIDFGEVVVDKPVGMTLFLKEKV
jgi:hypothetical protein